MPGQFWSVPLSDGRFACGRVLRVGSSGDHGRRTLFIGALLDWVGAEPPTAQSIARAPVLESGYMHVRAFQQDGAAILGHRDLAADEIVAPTEERKYWGSGYCRARAERRFVSGEPLRRWEIREVSSPLTDQMLRPIQAATGHVQFKSLLSDEDFQRLADWMRPQANLTLRAYGSYDGSIRDLEFLRFFPFITSFSADALYHSLESLAGLRHLSEDLRSLGIGWTKRRLDLGIIARFAGLTSLYVEGQTKGIEVISSLSALEALTLRSITLPDLSVLRPLDNLLSLEIKLGGTSSLGLLPVIGRICYLELWMIRGFSDASPVGRMPHLRYLFLQALRRVERLPDFSGAVELRRVHLETMKGLRDLSPLTTAPALEELDLVDMRHLQPDDLRCLLGMPKLVAMSAGMGSLRKNNAVRAMFGLPEVRALRNGWRDL